MVDIMTDLQQLVDERLDGVHNEAAWAALVQVHGPTLERLYEQELAIRQELAALPDPDMPEALVQTLHDQARAAAKKAQSTVVPMPERKPAAWPFWVSGLAAAGFFAAMLPLLWDMGQPRDERQLAAYQDLEAEESAQSPRPSETPSSPMSPAREPLAMDTGERLQESEASEVQFLGVGTVEGGSSAPGDPSEGGNKPRYRWADDALAKEGLRSESALGKGASARDEAGPMVEAAAIPPAPDALPADAPSGISNQEFEKLVLEAKDFMKKSEGEKDRVAARHLADRRQAETAGKMGTTTALADSAEGDMIPLPELADADEAAAGFKLPAPKQKQVAATGAVPGSEAKAPAPVLAANPASAPPSAPVIAEPPSNLPAGPVNEDLAAPGESEPGPMVFLLEPLVSQQEVADIEFWRKTADDDLAMDQTLVQLGERNAVALSLEITTDEDGRLAAALSLTNQGEVPQPLRSGELLLLGVTKEQRPPNPVVIPVPEIQELAPGRSIRWLVRSHDDLLVLSRGQGIRVVFAGSISGTTSWNRLLKK